MTSARAGWLAVAALCAPCPAQIWPIPHTHDHVQGLEVSSAWFWISAADRREKTGWIWRVDRRTLRTVVERELTQGELYHPGGLQVAGTSLWVPLAEYRPSSNSVILELDAMTLKERRSFRVQDHIGAVATDGRTRLLGVNWDARLIYRWNMGGDLVEAVPNPTPLAIQDMKWIDGALWAGAVGRSVSQGQCVLAKFDPSTLVLQRGSVLGGSLCYTREGMALYGGRFFFLPEDEPNSRVYAMGAPR